MIWVWVARHAWKLAVAAAGLVVFLAPLAVAGSVMGRTNTAALAGAVGSIPAACDTGPLAAPVGVGDVKTAGTLTPEQTQNATTIAQVAEQATKSAGHPELAQQAAVIGLITAMQESTLRNLTYGDRDSLGLFQQRNAWGTANDRTTPATAAGMFYLGGQAGQRGLLQVPGWQGMRVGDAAQTVQVSAFPLAYAQWENMARVALSTILPGLPALPAQPATTGCGIPGDIPTDLNVGAPGADTSRLTCPTYATDGGAHKTARGNSVRTCKVDGIVVNASVATNVHAMVTAAAADGITLAGGGFRSYEEQIAAGKANHCSGWPNWTSSSQCSPPTAPPGTSQHEQGLAIDFRLTAGVWAWLHANEARFGFKQLPSEAWHHSTTGR